jgi:hypothetical protein
MELYPDKHSSNSMFKTLLGNAWPVVPKPVREMHDQARDTRLSGLAAVERGNGVLARLIAGVFRFPTEGKNIPIDVMISKSPGQETWKRTFGDRSFSSVLSPCRGTGDCLLSERFGPFSFQLALVVANDKLNYIVRGWKFFGLPLPRAWAPGGDSYESSKNGVFGFDIEIAHPLAGLIVRYAGTLTIAE